MTIARIVAPTPTPTPKPTPTPAPQHAISVSKAVSATQVPIPVAAAEGKAAHKEAIKRAGAARPKPPKTIHTKPIWDTVPTGGQGAGAGSGEGAGSLGNGVNGSGTGAQGNGAGGGGAPCGAVDFLSKGTARINDATGRYERDNVQAIVHFSDGTAQTVDLDWTWSWASEAQDPFSNNDAPMLFQFPPAAQRASEPSLVQYIMRYSRAKGTTLLNASCPNIPPPPTPGP